MPSHSRGAGGAPFLRPGEWTLLAAIVAAVVFTSLADSKIGRAHV